MSKLFNEKLFRIPDYQRGYSWSVVQLEDFWTDLIQIGTDGNHYTGVITLEPVPPSNYTMWLNDLWIITSRSFSPFFVVDGQQRLTTIIILIQCIIEVSSGSGRKLNYQSIQEVQKRFIFETKDEGISRSYIFGYEIDNPSYEYLKTSIFGENSASDRSEETAYTHNLQIAKRFFLDKLSSLSHSEIEDVYTKITQKLVFNVFTISESVDVCVAFETMNNRGKPLSYLELLKNRLIYLSTKLAIPSDDAQLLRRTVNECWKTIYHNLGRDRESQLDDDFFLRAHHILNYVEPAPDTVADESAARKHSNLARALNEPVYKDLLKHIFTLNWLVSERNKHPQSDKVALNTINDYSLSLQTAVKEWYAIFNPKPTSDPDDYNFWLSKLTKITHESLYPVLLAIMLETSDNKKRLDAFKAVERLSFIDRLVSGQYQGLFYSDLVNSAIKLTRGQITIEKIIVEINILADRLSGSDWGKKQIKDALRRRNYYSWRPTLYFLYEYNLQLQLTSKSERTKIDWAVFSESERDYKSIEHIYPQTAQIKYWRDRFQNLKPAQRELLKNVIGNLLPLSKPKNSSLSNGPFDEKVNGKSVGVGYAYGSYAENEIYVRYKEWTPQSILDRSLNLLDFMEARWGLNLGKDSEKIEILGLRFVEPQARIYARRFGSSLAGPKRR
jgi:hypothetical protein